MIDEAFFDVTAGGRERDGRQDAGLFGFFEGAFGRIGQDVVGEAPGHQTGAGQGDGHPGCVDGDPAPSPLFGNVGGGARAAGGVKHQVAGVSGHQHTTLNNF